MSEHEINVTNIFIKLVIALAVSGSPLVLAFWLETKGYIKTMICIFVLYVLFGLYAAADLLAK